jgi:hypothetical protein
MAAKAKRVLENFTILGWLHFLIFSKRFYAVNLKGAIWLDLPLKEIID